MKLLKNIAVSSLVLGALAAPALADDAAAPAPSPWGTVTGNIALTNDYVFRGFSQTLEHAAIQGGLDWDSGMGIYVGTWGSNIEFTRAPGEGSMEWDVYGGYRGTIGKFSYDVGAIGYIYPGTASALSYNYWEAKLVLGYDFGFAQLAGSFYYSPDAFGGLDDSYYYNAHVTVPVIDKLTVDGAIGRQDFKRPGVVEFTDYQIGATYTFPWFSLDVRWYDTNLNSAACTVATGTNTYKTCDSRFVATIKRTF